MGYEKFSYSFDGAWNVLVTNWWGMTYLLKTTCNDSHLKLSDITLIANEHPDGESSDSDMDYDNDIDIKGILLRQEVGESPTGGLHIFCETYNIELLSGTDNTGMLF